MRWRFGYALESAVRADLYLTGYGLYGPWPEILSS